MRSAWADSGVTGGPASTDAGWVVGRIARAAPVKVRPQTHNLSEKEKFYFIRFRFISTHCPVYEHLPALDVKPKGGLG